MPLIALLALSAFGGTLSPGDPAPKIAVKSWYKGAPVTELEPAKTYVVEFWATWCGPCRQTIPHLTQMAKRNPDVTFVGVSVWEDDRGGNIKKFVRDMGATMDYHVGYSGNQDGMAQTWMKAAGQNGIPTAFVVKENKVVWIGHPMELEEPLEEIKADAFDLAKFKKEFASGVRETAAPAAVEDAKAKYDRGDRAVAKAALAQALKDDSDLEDQVNATRLGWLAREDPKAWDARARTLARSGRSADMRALMIYAREAAAKAGSAPLARRAASLALAAEPRGFDALTGALAVYQATKDDAKALAIVKNLLAWFPTGRVGENPNYKGELLRMKAELTKAK